MRLGYFEPEISAMGLDLLLQAPAVCSRRGEKYYNVVQRSVRRRQHPDGLLHDAPATHHRLACIQAAACLNFRRCESLISVNALQICVADTFLRVGASVAVGSNVDWSSGVTSPDVQ